MANKTKLTSLPLEGTINLSHNKLDVHDPGNNGFLKNNGAVYGNILSPVYRMDTGTFYEVYDSNKRPFSIGRSTLVLNDEVIMDYTPRTFKTETLDLTYVDSVYEDKYIRVLNEYVEYFDGNNIDYIDFEGSVILATRIINNVLVFFYKNSNNQYVIDFKKDDITQTFTVAPSSIGAPIITYCDTRKLYNNPDAVLDVTDDGSRTYIASIITDNGATTSADSFSYVIRVDSAGILSVTSVSFISTSTASITTQTETQILLSDVIKYKLGTYDCDSYGLGIYYNTSGNILRIRGNSDVSATLYYMPTDQKTRDEIISMPFASPITEIQNTSDYTNKTWAVQLIGNDNARGTHTYPEPIFCVATDDMTTLDKVNGYLVVSFHNVIVNGETTDLTLKWLPSTSYYSSISAKKLNTVLDDIDFKGADGSWYYEDGTPFEYNYVTVAGEAIISPLPNFNCDAILDTGHFITLKNLPYDSNNILSQGTYCFTGTYNRIEGNIVYYDVDDSKKILLAQQDNKAAAYPYYYVEQTKSLGYGYFRESLITKGADNETITQILYDTSSNSVVLNPGYNSETKTNGKGGVAEINGWRILYNNNYISGISYSEDENKVGTLLTDWNNIAKILYVSESDLYYIDVYNKVIHLWIENVVDFIPYSYIENRFIVINTTSYFNCYDTINNVQLHYASDYNNRFQEGAVINDALIQNDTNTGYLQAGVSNVIDGSAQNANYEMTNDPIVGLVLAAEVLSNTLVKSYNKIKSETNSTGIDYYRSVDTTNAIYDLSYKNSVEYKNTLLEDAIYPTDTPIYNPNIFTTYISTYNQRDMALNKATSTAYPLMKYNGQIFLAYLLTAGLENAEVIFAIQTLHYMVSNGYIYEIYYNGSEIDTYQAIMPSKGLTYLGCLPTEALFWNALDRSVYSFAGDAIMRKAYQWNDVSEIRGTWYNPATQELFIATDLGLLCLSNQYQYLLSDLLDVNNIVFFEDYFIVQDLSDIYVKYEADETTNIPGNYNYYSGILSYQTDYLGSNTLKSHFDCLYIRVAKVNGANGYLRIKASTITDMGVETDEASFEFDASTFDDLTNSIYLRYQPKYQKACAISFEIESTNPIICHELGYNTLDEIPAISSINI